MLKKNWQKSFYGAQTDYLTQKGSGIDEPLTMERGGSLYYYHRDGLGSVTEISDAGGTLVERYEYDVYGAATIFDSTEIRTCLRAGATPPKAGILPRGRNPALPAFRARIYSPTLGRFLQTDPHRQSADSNKAKRTLSLIEGKKKKLFLDKTILHRIILGVNIHHLQLIT